MSYETTRTFFALLALAANAATIVLVFAAVAGRVSTGGAELRDRIVGSVAGWELWFGFAVATTAMLGSLYLSEIQGLIPCDFCWYQRIAMYPLAVILLIAAVRGDHGIRLYAATLATIGALLATYHYLIQWYPDLEAGSCSTVSCTSAWFRVFGFISIPYMALSGFLLILALLWADRRNSPRTRASSDLDLDQSAIS